MLLEEMIIKLRANINKKYVSEEGTRDELHAFIEDGCIKFEYVTGKKETIRKINLDRKWEELRESVSWKEAFEAGLNGKRIKPKGQGLTYGEFQNLHYAMMYLGQRPSYFRKIMLDEWYIE